MSTKHYTSCPVCGSSTINPLMKVKDHSVTGELFDVWLCSSCQLRFTQDAPDEQEIVRYYNSPDYISHSNTSRGLVNRLYQLVRNRTLRAKSNLIISKTVAQGTVLDIGAGIGAFLHTMQQRSWRVVGVEPDAGARLKAQELFSLPLQTPDALSTLPGGTFDAITLWHVLEHVHALHEYVETLRQLLTPAGKIFIAVPNYQSADADAYKSYWAAYDVPRHLYHFSPQSINTLVTQHGLRVAEIKPMWYDSFYISLLSSKYKNGKVRWPGAIWNGIKSNAKALFSREHCSSIIYVIERDGNL